MSKERSPIESWFSLSAPELQQRHWTPAADVYRVENGWLLKFDLAGVRPGDIHLKLSGRQFTVSGRRGDWIVKEIRSCCAYSMEINYSQFERTIELPAEIEHLQIQSEYRDGMLLVSLQDRGSLK